MDNLACHKTAEVGAADRGGRGRGAATCRRTARTSTRSSGCSASSRRSCGRRRRGRSRADRGDGRGPAGGARQDILGWFGSCGYSTPKRKPLSSTTSLSRTVRAWAMPSKPCSARSSPISSRAVVCVWWVIVGRLLVRLAPSKEPAMACRFKPDPRRGGGEFTETRMHYLAVGQLDSPPEPRGQASRMEAGAAGRRNPAGGYYTPG